MLTARSIVTFVKSLQDRNLDRMTRIAAGSESMDIEDWMPSRIYLSVPLMWRILQFNSTAASQEIPTAGLLHGSLTPRAPPEDNGESSMLEIVVATSPEITINTADGGQEAPTLSYKAPMPPGASGPASSRDFFNSPGNDQVDSLTFNTTPWLYADSSQLVNIGDMGFPQSEPGAPWWEDDNSSNILFNQF